MITVSELHAKISREEAHEKQIIDVRTPAERKATHIAGSRFFQLDALDPEEVFKLKEKEIYLLCHSGARAEKAAEMLSRAGGQSLHVIEGGIVAWKAEGCPVLENKSVMSLERQVRIAAGLLVFSGSVLALVFNQNWLFLPAFVGAGLMFAGISNTCGMGMMIAKMPWNR
ncbi:MAG: rhodanese-like domain-containing protein [Akkermansiaceae bacterium]